VRDLSLLLALPLDRMKGLSCTRSGTLDVGAESRLPLPLPAAIFYLGDVFALANEVNKVINSGKENELQSSKYG
jgi:hypothetical protein